MVKKAVLAAALSVFLLASCGEIPENDFDGSMPTAASEPPVEYISSSSGQTTTSAASEETTVSERKTGTELATTYTDENGNIYGIEPTVTAAPEVTAVPQTEPENTTTEDIALYGIPDVPADEYYNRLTATDTERTVPSETQTIAKTEHPTVTTKVITQRTETTPETTTTTTRTETTAELYDNAADANAKRIERRNARIPSSYTGKNEVMHTNSFYYLSDNERYAYDVIVDAMLNYEDAVEFPISKKITFDELFNAYQCVYTDEVRLFYIDTLMEYVTDSSTGYVTNMRLSYIYSRTRTANMQKQIDAQADAILSKITPGMSDYDIVRLIHDSIIKDCTYTTEGANITSIYGALSEKKAQCQGYTRAFSYLCEKCGIETDIVLGVAIEDHMWNMVKIDGKWYHIDLTWDDPDKTRYPDSVRYDYFCLSTARMQELRSITGNTHELPDADSDDYEYYSYNGLVAYSYDDAREIILREAVRASGEGASTIQFRCSDSETFREIYNILFDDSEENSDRNAISILEEALILAPKKYYTDSVYHNTNESTYTMKLYLDYE